jgi:hypothetical protein
MNVSSPVSLIHQPIISGLNFFILSMWHCLRKIMMKTKRGSLTQSVQIFISLYFCVFSVKLKEKKLLNMTGTSGNSSPQRLYQKPPRLGTTLLYV